ncbi:28S ribosomal protein S7, mitochondrial [Halotydeus destructor]|nr:28S ribosomal protein S7, mitochondrial [Halotydeus destructor]
MSRLVFTELCSKIVLSSQYTSLVLPVRTSVWPANYIDPISKKQLEELKEEDALRELAFKPVKAVVNYASSSVYCDADLLRFEKMIMRKGKKDLARDLLMKTMWEIKKIQVAKYRNASEEDRPTIELDPAKVVKKAIENCQPVIISKPIKRGGATYQVPFPVTSNWSQFLAIKWLIDTIKERPKPRKDHFPESMAKELVAAHINEGKVIKKKHDLHKLCEANKAYAHYRWG